MVLEGLQRFLRRLKNGSRGQMKANEFIWDRIVKYVVLAIIVLAAMDFFAVFIHGREVSCFAPLGSNLPKAQEEFMNSYCVAHLPSGAYISYFMTIYAILVTIPHHLWSSHYDGNFDYLFTRSRSLQIFRENGEHVQANLQIVHQIQENYKRNTCMFMFYKLKLLLQLLGTIAGLALAIVYFMHQFDFHFMCPKDFSNSTHANKYPFWPVDSEVPCVYPIIRTLHMIWIMEIVLLSLACLGFFWALLWCHSIHTTELGAKKIALFSFKSGLALRLYTPRLSLPRCCPTILARFLRMILSPFASDGPKIKTDLDFLVMRLFKTDYRLGYVFKEVQVERELKILFDEDLRRLANHKYIHTELTATNLTRTLAQEGAIEGQDLKWKFTKLAGQRGIFESFHQLHISQLLLLTNTMRGAVLGFGQRASSNGNALTISFGDHGVGTALGRVFHRTASINFSPHYFPRDDNSEVITVREYQSNTITMITSDDVISANIRHFNQFVDSLRNIWSSPGNNLDFHETSYIVVGPIPTCKDFNITSLHLFFNLIYGCIEPGAVLLTIRPLEIAGKRVGDRFIAYEPSPPHFAPLRQSQPHVCADDVVREWPARRSFQSTQQDNNLEELSSQPSNLSYKFILDLQCGSTQAKVEFSTYYYTDTEKVQRPRAFDPVQRYEPTPT